MGQLRVMSYSLGCCFWKEWGIVDLVEKAGTAGEAQTVGQPRTQNEQRMKE
jgi:hypothetical protein